MFIPDPTFLIPDPNFSIPDPHQKKFMYFNLKKWFISSRKYDPGCHPGSPDSESGSYFLPIPDQGVKKAPDPDPQHWTFQAVKFADIVKFNIFLNNLCEKLFIPHMQT